MPEAPIVFCRRCGAHVSPQDRGCPACLFGAGHSPGTASDDLFDLASRLPPPDRERLLAEAERESPGIAGAVRRRLERAPGFTRGASESVPRDGGADAPWGIHENEEAPGSRIGAFQIVRCLGEGGMGTVWEAEQQVPVRRTVALKLIRLGMHTREVVKRFERERQTLALLNHPNIAQVFEAGVTPSGRPYFVMERVSGCPISEACVAEALPLRERLRLFLEICAAVEHAHQKGVIHRDLKPSNILVGGGRVKVIDFGIAKATHEAGDSLVTRRAQILGTPAYMSPEQAQSAGAHLDTRTDVYALGGILYELLAGVPPFDATRLAKTSLADMQRILLEEDPPAPSERVASRERAGERPDPAAPRSGDLRGDLDRVVMKALRKDREQRYSSAAALADDLRRHLSGEPVMAVPPTLGYRLGKFVRRNRVAVAGAALTLAALVAGLAVSIQQAIRARGAERAAIRTLADMSTRSGLAADAADDASRAALWFAHAAVIAGEDPVRREANRHRAAAWRATFPTPVRAIDSGFQYLGSLTWNPRYPALLLGSEPPGQCRVWDLSTDRPWPATEAAHVSAALWDSSGDRIALAEGTRIRVLEFPSGRELAALDHATPSSWAFRPGTEWIAIGSVPSLLWNWSSGERQPLPRPDEPASRLDFSPDGTRLLLTWPGLVGLVAVTNPQVLLHEPVPNAPGAMALFLGAGGRYVTGGTDGSVQVRDVHRGVVQDAYPGAGQDAGFPLTASPDGRILVRRNATALDLATRTPLNYPVHQNVFTAAAFSPDGTQLATGGYDDVLNLWDVATGRQVRTVGHHQHAVVHLAMSPDGRQLASGQDGLVRVWRLARDAARTSILPGADSLARLSPDGRMLVASGLSHWDGALVRTRAWKIPSGDPAGPELDPGGVILDAGFSPDNRGLVLAVSTTPDRRHHGFETNAGSGNLQWWHPVSGDRLSAPIPLPAEPRGVALHPSGDPVAVICGDGQLLEVSRASGTSNSVVSRHRFPTPYAPHATMHNGACVYSPDGRWLAAWGVGEGLAVWDRQEKRLCVDVAPGTGTVFDVSFHQDTLLAARMSQNSSLDFRTLPSGAESVPSIPYPNWPFLARFDATGERILVTGRDRAGHLWDRRTGQRVGPALPHNGEVMAGAFIPASPWVVTGGHDGLIRFWEVPSGMMIGPTLDVGGAVLTLQITPDSRTLIACGNLEGRVDLYDWDRLFPRPTLGVGDARRLAEIEASAVINTEGGLVPMSAPEWLAHWREFRSRHPEFTDHAVAPLPLP